MRELRFGRGFDCAGLRLLLERLWLARARKDTFFSRLRLERGQPSDIATEDLRRDRLTV